MTFAQRLGTGLLISGSLIVICVLLIWIIPPLAVPDESSFVSNSPSNNSLPLAPPLSPISAQIKESEDRQQRDYPITDDSRSQNNYLEKRSFAPSSSNWNVVPYKDAHAIISQELAQSEMKLRISIPSLNIDAPVIPVSQTSKISRNGREYSQWSVPDEYAVGWHDDSAEPGQVGNTVLNGHNNIHGAIFKNLVDLTLGEQIVLSQGDTTQTYEVVHREFLPEKGEPLRNRLRNARWIAPSDDDRLTIVTCWPNSSNSHRLVVIAIPQSSKIGF